VRPASAPDDPGLRTGLPIVENLFQPSGYIGYLCDHVRSTRDAIQKLAGEMDASHCHHQVAVIRVPHDIRTPEMLPERHRAIVRKHVPTMDRSMIDRSACQA
jgi:hypothetical protein